MTALDAALALAALAYLLGACPSRITLWRRCALLAGLGVIGLALASPLDDLADRLLSAHMLQHLLLMLVAAPLLVAGVPLRAAWRLLPRVGRRALGRALQRRVARALRTGFERPALAWILFCGGLGVWHLPRVYRWAVAAESRHMLMHVCFLVGGCAFWATVRRVETRRGLDYARTILYVLAAALVTGLPGAVLAFAGHLVYAQPTATPLPFGLTALADQQLAGLLMWIPMDLVLFSVAVALFTAWLRGMDRRGTPSADTDTRLRALNPTDPQY